MKDQAIEEVSMVVIVYLFLTMPHTGSYYSSYFAPEGQAVLVARKESAVRKVAYKN